MTMQLDRDFSEFVASFVSREVRFLIVGGYAVAAHGLPRATGDLDTWVWTDPANAKRVVAALEDFGFGSLGLEVEDFTRPGSVVQLGYPPHRIDIMTSVVGVDFEDAWERRMPMQIDDVTVHVIGLDDLIRNKEALGRPQDLADVARLRGHSETR
jgi:hypothetical protein